MTDRSGPLDGVVVVEVANWVSAPLGTMMLADMGAEVIKVEPPTGDPLRRLGRHDDMSPLFVNSNRGKKSVALDLRDERDRARLGELLGRADVFVTNTRPAALQRLGLDDARIAAQHPRLIRVLVSGYGPAGPLATAPTFDGIIQARSGQAAIQGDADAPALANGFVVDKVCATIVCQVILAALLDRERHGTVDRIDVAMLDAAAYFNFPDAFEHRTFVDRQPPHWRNEQAAATRPIAASDGWLVVAPVTARQIRRAFEVAGIPETADEVLRLTGGGSIARRFQDELERVTRRGSVADWVERFNAHDVPAAPCLDLDGHLQDEQVVHNQIYSIDDWEPVGRVRHVRYPAVFSSYESLRARGGPPTIDQDRREVLDSDG